MDANDKIYVTLSVIIIIILLIILVLSATGTLYRLMDTGERYRNGEGVLGTEAESRGITALTSHNPPELRPFNTRT